MHSARPLVAMPRPSALVAPSSFAFAFAFPALIAACSVPATVLRAPAETAASPGPAREAVHPRTLVWVQPGGGGGAPVTYVVADGGEVVTKVPGILVAAADTEWTWEEVSEPVATVACEGGPSDEPAGEGRATRVRLVPSDSRHEPLAIVVPPDVDGANEVDHSARLLASVGPYLFVEESTYTYACGAHGQTTVRFSVWDLERRTTLDLLAEVPDRDRLVATAKGALDEDPDAVDMSDADDPPTLTELLPRVGPHGRLEANALVTVPSCYACTSGGWSSYTSSTPVPAEVPARLRQLGPVPKAVEIFTDAHPELTIGGYSVEAASAPFGSAVPGASRR